MNALVVGCGGTGSEIIKLLKLYNFEITCIDFDKIETSNLARQFYFTDKDRGRYKSEVIGEKIKCNFLTCKFENIEYSFLNNFDAVFSCVDNISTRMEINFAFKNSKSNLLFDLGTEGFDFHVKKVSQNTSCLYCIKSLYNTNKFYTFCTLTYKDIEITNENRQNVLNTYVLKGKENEKSIEEIVVEFNNKLNKNFQKTTIFEVEGIYKNIIPSICTTNSICASIAIDMLRNNSNYDFVYGSSQFNYHKIEISKDCILCNKNNK